MKIRWLKKVLIFVGLGLLVIFIVLIVLFYQFAKPNTDEQIVKKLSNEIIQPVISFIDYDGKKVRIIKMQEVIDTTLPTLVFVHGSPGSSLDFKKYLVDVELNTKTNIIAYDRIGYGCENTGDVLNSITEEVHVLNKMLESINPNKIILIGYSYGGTVVMASQKKYKKKIVLAAAVKGDLEPMFWVLNLFKWETTRPLIPKIIQAAAKEKLKHVTELPNFENIWNTSETKVISIHGTTDMIVPFQNSLYLKTTLDTEKFDLISIENGSHALVWTEFNLIKNVILKAL